MPLFSALATNKKLTERMFIRGKAPHQSADDKKRDTTYFWEQTE
jgi:hypothetical protein